MILEVALRSRLVEARLRTGKTQTEIATALGWQQSRVSKLETGEKYPRFVEVVRLARIYGASITYFTEVVR